MKLGDRLMTLSSERQRTSGPQERTKSDFMYCRKFTLRAARNLVKEFRGVGNECCLHMNPHSFSKNQRTESISNTLPQCVQENLE